MSETTIPIFVVGSGRSGTRMIYKLLTGVQHIEIYHEYLCTHIQQAAALYHMKVIDKEEVKKRIMGLHGSAIYYSKARYWVDCSNKLSWIIEPLFELFPQAKFVNITRDGRKVANSFFHKLPDEVYDDESVKIMQEWLANKDKLPMPPPEKKYWWNIPQKNQPFEKEFSSFNQFQRCCMQWVEAYRTILNSLEKVPQKQQLTIKLEDLISNKDILKEFLSFFDVPYEEHFFEFLQKPQNVIYPLDFKLTEEQNKQFFAIAGEMMKRLGYYEHPEYNVKY